MGEIKREKEGEIDIQNVTLTDRHRDKWRGREIERQIEKCHTKRYRV